MGFIERAKGMLSPKDMGWKAEVNQQDQEERTSDQEAKKDLSDVFFDLSAKLGLREFYSFVNKYTRELAKKVESGEMQPLEWLSAEGKETINKVVEDRAKDGKRFNKELTSREENSDRYKEMDVSPVPDETLEEQIKGVVVSILEGAARGSDVYLEDSGDVVRMLSPEMLKDITAQLEQRLQEEAV